MYKMYVGKTDEGKFLVEINREDQTDTVNSLRDLECKDIKVQELDFAQINQMLLYPSLSTPEKLQKVFQALMLLNAVYTLEEGHSHILSLLEGIATLAINLVNEKT